MIGKGTISALREGDEVFYDDSKTDSKADD
jgi:hypothetical protein